MYLSTCSLTTLKTLLTCLLLNAATAGLEPTTRVYRVGVSGSSVSLPCQLPALPAPPALVLWYRGASTKPFYSYDGRASHGLGSHKLHDASQLRGRVTFLPNPGSYPYQGMVGQLRLDHIRLSDADNYTCRVDFLQAQTRMAMLTLDVHEPVQKLVVVDAHEKQVQETAGPYEEGTAVYLTCRAYGGYPVPKIEWYDISANHSDGDHQNRRASPSSLALASTRSPFSVAGEQGEGFVESILEIENLHRQDHNRKFVCQASNSHLMDALLTEIDLEVYYGPKQVELEGLQGPLDAGREAVAECRVAGSRPPPLITWLPDTLFATLGAPQSRSGNVTVSKARLVPGWEDDGVAVSCTATNPSVSRLVATATRTLSVRFAPRVAAILAPTIDQHSIKEGDDVYFECQVKANPPPREIVWLHKDAPLPQGRWAGGVALLHSDSLVLQELTRAAEGEYRCQAENDIGKATSDGAMLKVMYPPECSTMEPVVVSALPDEHTVLSCLVNSPSPSVNFRWSVNTSRGLAELNSELITNVGPESTLDFVAQDHEPLILMGGGARPASGRYQDIRTPSGEEVFGVVYCRATSQFGEQKKPCTFVVKPAGPPGELISCTLVNQSATSLAVSCDPGHNGGLQQSFSVKVVDESSGLPVTNVTSLSPDIIIEHLAPGQDYLVEVRAVNAKGVSAPFILQGFALKVAENKIHDPGPPSVSPHLLPVLVGSVAGVVVMVLLLILLTRLRHSGRNASREASLPVLRSDRTCPSPDSSGGLDSLRPLKEVTNRGTITDNIAQKCYKENESFEDELHCRMSRDHDNEECVKTTYDVIYDDSTSSQRVAKLMENNRRSQSFSYHSLSRIRASKLLNPGEENVSKEENNMKEISHGNEKQYFGNTKGNRTDVGQVNNIKLKEPSSPQMPTQSQIFSYPSLKRRRKEEGEGSSVTLITTPTSGTGELGTCVSEVSKVAQLRQSPPTHTQLVNCKGHDEILLDSDNLTSATKFQNCTRRRDESFV